MIPSDARGALEIEDVRLRGVVQRIDLSSHKVNELARAAGVLDRVGAVTVVRHGVGFAASGQRT